jgi:hypothetical protein
VSRDGERRRHRRLRIAVTAIVTTLVLVYSRAPAAAKPDYTRRTNKPCTFCHPGPGWVLNDAGQYYRDHHYSLKGYDPKPAPKSPQ